MSETLNPIWPCLACPIKMILLIVKNYNIVDCIRVDTGCEINCSENKNVVLCNLYVILIVIGGLFKWLVVYTVYMVSFIFTGVWLNLLECVAWCLINKRSAVKTCPYIHPVYLLWTACTQCCWQLYLRFINMLLVIYLSLLLSKENTGRAITSSGSDLLLP